MEGGDVYRQKARTSGGGGGVLPWETFMIWSAGTSDKTLLVVGSPSNILMDRPWTLLAGSYGHSFGSMVSI